MCASLWAMAESTSRQIVAPNFSLISYITYLSLMILPFAMAMYFDRLQDGRYRILYLMAAVLDLFVAFIGVILQFYNNTDLSGVLTYAFIGIIISLALFFVTIICDFIQGNLKLYWMEIMQRMLLGILLGINGVYTIIIIILVRLIIKDWLMM